MRLKILKAIFFAVMLGVFSACINDKPYDNVATIKTFDLVANKTVADINGLATATPTVYSTDDIIEGYVTSNDETGNFFSTICMQTIGANGINPIGFSVSADFKSFGHGFTPGRKVYIKLKGLYYARVDGSLKIGGLFNNNGTNQIGRIATADWDKFLFAAAVIVPENDLVVTRTVAMLNNDSNLNILTDIDNVQFADGALSRTLFDIDSGGGATNHIIIGVGTTNTSVVRTSSFATIARSTVPAGRGKIRGVLTKFGTTYQFYIRNLDDLKLNSPRVYSFVSALNEGFQSFATNQRVFPNYLNFVTAGTKEWTVRAGNFLQMSAFGGNFETNKSYFIIPVNMTAANSLSFQMRIDFFTNKLGFNIYRTMDYVPGMKISDATLIDISGSFSLPTTSVAAFANVGSYLIPQSIAGNGYFVFEYTGSNISTQTPVTTTVQIDNIIVN
ncbi:MAG: hypothetical protein RLZZ312_946 [Bacteroidota bacterium]|jgi:hypothetical protein